MKDCNQCGKCCIKYGGGDLVATQEEIDQWEQFNPEIFIYVRDNEIWFDPDTSNRLTKCPFLELAPKINQQAPDKYTCRIYLHRPEDCRQYPSLINEMVRDVCEMIEARDLKDPAKAQAKLNLLMSDSRPFGKM